MKINIKAFITCKSAEKPSDCADNYAFNSDSHKFAISDGVSRSFFPKYWSEALVSNFVNKDYGDNQVFIEECQKDWLSKITEIVNSPGTKWFTRAEYNRKNPALATFVGLKFDLEKKTWRGYAIGDSFLFFVPRNFVDFENELKCLSSKQLIDEKYKFDNFPDYLSSVGNSHKGYPGKFLAGKIVPGTFYLMTDALAEWFINSGANVVGLIEPWTNQDHYQKFIDELRSLKQIADDDCAIMVINIQDDGNDEICYSDRIDEQFTRLSDLIMIEEEENKQLIKNHDSEVGNSEKNLNHDAGDQELIDSNINSLNPIEKKW